LTSLTGILFLCILLTAIGWKFPRASGPNIRVSLILIEPCSNVPETTVPTPCQIQKLL
jgi:hypothetical protein